MTNVLPKPRNGIWFYVAGGVFIAIGIFNNKPSTGPLTSVTYRTPEPISIATPIPVRRDVRASTPVPVATPVSAEEFLSSTPTPIPTRTPEVRRAERYVRESHPPSDNYVPNQVKLTSPEFYPIYDRGVQSGLAAAPIGTMVRVIQIEGDKIDVNLGGELKTIPVTHTDLLQRMLGTADE